MNTQAWQQAEVPREQDARELLTKYFANPKILLATLAFATGILYSGTLAFQFVWDDETQIVNNPIIRSWHNLSRIFFSDLWYHTGRQQIYYRPLFVLWSIVNYALAGLHPWGWHFGAILLHLGATLAVYCLVRRLGLDYWTASIATVIFALHPVHIESVAWISAASDSMVAMFAALAFVAFVKARDPNESKKFAWHSASWLLLGCALLTKEMAVSFAALVGVYVWLNPGEQSKSALTKLRDASIAIVPYAAVTLVYFMLRKAALAQSITQFDVRHGYADMALTLPKVLVLYMRQLLVPIEMTGLYYTPYVTDQFLKQVALPSIVLLAVAGLIAYWAHKKHDWVVAFAGLWLIIGLAPALYLRNFGNGDFVRDRYMYLPSIGFAILLAKAIRLLPGIKGWAASTVQGAAFACIAATYIVVSIPQQAYWDSDMLIYLRGYQLYPENPYAAIGLGREYSRLGVHDRAIALVADGVRRRPDDLRLVYALAEVYIAAGRKDEGRKALEYALQVMPQYAESETGMTTVAAYWAQLDNYDRALALCEKVLVRDPNLYSAIYNCGSIQLMAGHYGVAEELLRRSMQEAPELSDPRHFLGRALLLDGNNAEALPYLTEAAAMNPTVWDYHYWLGVSLEKSGNVSAARVEYERTLQLNSGSSEAKLRLTALEGK